jgi:CRP-like cAMP-binding protein
MDPTESLLRYPLFGVLGWDWVRDWVESVSPERSAMGEEFVRQGETPDDLFLVETGRLRVLRSNGIREVSLGIGGPGTLFGDHALLATGRSRATVRAAADSTVRRLPLASVLAAVASRSELAPHLRAWVRLHFAVRFLRDESCLGFMSPESFLPLLA